MKLIDVKKSSRKNKKWVAEFCMCEGSSKCKPNERKFVHFGDSQHSDYTIHKDKKRRESYRKRSAAAKNAPPDTAAALAYHLLWGDATSIKENIKSFKNLYNI
jgi:hypothetical protein